MKTYQVFITELFDKPLPYHLSHSIEDREEVYEFKTPKGQSIEVSIVVAKNGAYEFMFDNDGDGNATKTNKGEEFRIFSTVLKILKGFVDDEAPDHFFIDAVKREPSRVRLFQRMIRKFTQLYPDYKAEKSELKDYFRWNVKVKPQ